MKRKLTLALETGIEGGSICLLCNSEEIAEWVGVSHQSHSVIFFESLQNVLASAQVKPRELSRIVISTGPGSYTGLRNGYSIAKGLKFSSKSKIGGVSPLNVLLENEGPITVGALPVGRNSLCWKRGLDSRKSRPQIWLSDFNYCLIKEFINIVELHKPSKLILHPSLEKEFLDIKILTASALKITYCDRNLARIIGNANCNLKNESQFKIYYSQNNL